MEGLRVGKHTARILFDVLADGVGVVLYFAVLPNYLPSDLTHIVPKSYRDNLILLAHQKRSWEEVEIYDKALSLSIEIVESEGAPNGQVLQGLLSLTQSHNVDVIYNGVREIKNKAAEQAGPQVQESLDLLEISVAKLRPDASQWYYPTIRWYGFNCQFHFWISKLLDRDANVSIKDGVPALNKISRALKWTLSISVAALLITFWVSILIGFYQVRYKESIFDKVSTNVTFFFFAVPLFWIATLFVVFFTTEDYGKWTDIFPSVGIKFWMIDEPFYKQLLASAGQLILPILCLTLTSLAYLSTQVKSSLLEVMSMPFIKTSRAKGLGELKILRNHGLPNAALPLITIFTGALPSTLVGSIIIEVIFNIPGVGRLLLQSIVDNDWPVSFLILVFVGVITILSYLLGDLLNVLFFPKMRDNLIKTG